MRDRQLNLVCARWIWAAKVIIHSLIIFNILVGNQLKADYRGQLVIGEQILSKNSQKSQSSFPVIHKLTTLVFLF